MDLIFEGQQVGKGVQNFTEYSLPGSSIRFIIIHGSQQSYWVGLPTNISIPRTLEIFKYIARIEPPESKTPVKSSPAPPVIDWWHARSLRSLGGLAI